MIPGNPHVPGGYDHFLQHLSGQLEYSKFIVLPHYGQSGGSETIAKPVTLDAILHYHQSQVRQLLKEESAEEVYLIAHSLGTSVVMALGEEILSRVHRILLICPFVGPIGKNRWFFKVAKTGIVRGGFQVALKAGFIFKMGFRKIFQKIFLKDQYPQFLSPEYNAQAALSNFIDSVADYQRFYETFEPEYFFNSYPKSQVLYLFAPKDFWVPGEVKALIPKASQTHELNIQHDFLLVPHQAEEVAKVGAGFFA